MDSVESPPPAATTRDVTRDHDSLWSLTTLTVGAVVIMFAWQLLGYLSTRLPVPAAVATNLAQLAAILALHARLWRGGPAASKYRESMRVRPLGARAIGLLLLAVPAITVATLSLALIGVHLHGDSAGGQSEMMKSSVSRPFGWVVVMLAVAGVAPLIEELMFRGRIQTALERRLGAVGGVLVTTVLFAVAHLAPFKVPNMLLSGLVYGMAVSLTGSVWAGVVLHVAHNAIAVVMLFLGISETSWPLSEISVVSAIALLLSGLLALWVIALRLRRPDRR